VIDSKTNEVYSTLAKAIKSIESGSITLLEDYNIIDDEPITISGSGKIITISSGQGAPKTIKRGDSNKNELFYVKDGASLVLDGSLAPLIIDGGGAESESLNYGPLINIYGGTLTMGEGVTLQNNASGEDGGGVFIRGNGIFNMTGGIIQDNNSEYGGGGVNLGANDSSANNTFNFWGGEIKNNTASHGGGIAITHGTVNMNDGAKITNNTSFGGGWGAGGGVMLETTDAVFNMSGGTIAGNISRKEGGGVYMESGTFNKTGGVVYGTDVDEDLKNTADLGDALYKGGGTAENNGNPLSTTDDTF
jgi:hypothetical protein